MLVLAGQFKKHTKKEKLNKIGKRKIVKHYYTILSLNVHVKNENSTQRREMTEDSFTVCKVSVHVFVAEDFNESSLSKILSSILCTNTIFCTMFALLSRWRTQP